MGPKLLGSASMINGEALTFSATWYVAEGAGYWERKGGRGVLIVTVNDPV
jgi:hypothetical protein